MQMYPGGGHRGQSDTDSAESDFAMRNATS
jgi:hypothetical protein